MTFLLGLVPSFIPAQYRKAAVFVMLAVLLLTILGTARCAYDRSVIKAHDAKRDAQIAKADRKADAKAAEQRRVDDTRITTETQELKEAVRAAPPPDRRRVYYECLARMQDARARGIASPSCRP